MKNFKPIYLLYAAIAALVIWAIWYFGFNKKCGGGWVQYAEGGLPGAAPRPGVVTPVVTQFVRPPTNPNPGRCIISYLNGGSSASTGSTITNSGGTHTCLANGSWSVT